MERLGRRSDSHAGVVKLGSHPVQPGRPCLREFSFFLSSGLLCSFSYSFAFEKINLYSLGEMLSEKSFVSCDRQ